MKEGLGVKNISDLALKEKKLFMEKKVFMEKN